MKKYLMTLLVVCGILTFGLPAHSLTIYGTGASTPILSGNETSQDEIDSAIESSIIGAIELYKSDFGGSESGLFASSYETVFSNFEDSNNNEDPSDATITWMGPNIVGDPKYLLVKDGNAKPAWYLFNLTSGSNNALAWNGTDNLELVNFWFDGRGSISHVTLYGATAVPEPATLILLGLGLLGIAGIRRKK